MANVNSFIVMFIILGLGEDSVEFEICQDDMLTSLANGVPRCDALQVYVKCYIRVIGAHKSLLTTDDDINTFKQTIETGLNKDGMHCDFNVKRYVKELLEEESLGVTYATRTNSGLSTLNGEKSVGINVCQDDLFTSLANGSPQCNAVQVFVKCYIRATGSYKSLLTTDDDINTFTQIIETGLRKRGIYCDLNVKRSVKELQEEDRLGVTYATRTVTEVTTHDPSKSCLKNYSISLTKGVPKCDALQIFVKCKLRESGSYKSLLTTDARSVYESRVKAKLAELGIYCDFDVKKMVEELEEEERQGLTYPTRKSTDYKNAKTVNECLEVFEAQNQLSCGEAASMIKCTIRLDWPYFSSNQMYDSEYQQADVLLRNYLSKMGLDCNLSVRQLLQEVERGELIGCGSCYVSGSVQLVTFITLTVLSVFISSLPYICM